MLRGNAKDVWRQAWQGEDGRSATLPYWYLREIFIQKPEVIFDDVVTNMSNQSVIKRGDVDNIISQFNNAMWLALRLIDSFPFTLIQTSFSVNKTIQGWSLQILIHVLLSANKRPVLAKAKRYREMVI